MSRRSIFRAGALQKRAQRMERAAPAPPVPSARAVRILWVLLVIALAGLVMLGRAVRREVDARTDAAPAESAGAR